MTNPTISPFFSDKVVPLDVAEMEPFYERDGAIRAHKESIARLQAIKVEYDHGQDEKIDELKAIVIKSRHVMWAMRQKMKAANARIFAAIDKKKNAAHNSQIDRHLRLIDERKTRINKRECGKTALKMSGELFQKLKQNAANNMKRKITMPSAPEDAA